MINYIEIAACMKQEPAAMQSPGRFIQAKTQSVLL